jgi:cysteine desulfuration protein SufE
MDLDDKIALVIKRFNQYSDWEDRYRELIKFGDELEKLSEDKQIEKYQVKGCQSQVWLVPEYRNGVISFQADSDAKIVKGIIGLIQYVYSGLTPEKILGAKADFLKEIGITEHLSMNRTNGLASMLKQIQMYAMAFKSLKDRGINHVDNF